MKVFFNAWFAGFLDRTNPGLTVDFFIELLSKTFKTPIEIGTLADSEVLCETVFGNTQLYSKKWKYSFLFSGENRYYGSWANNRYLHIQYKDYSCVMWGERNNGNIVNVPLFIPYIYTNKFVDKLETIHEKPITTVPNKDVCVIISNPNSPQRVGFLNKLEHKMNVTYAGRYKNNTGGFIPYDYNSKEFLDYISQFKFIISMENSRDDTYITEKVVHGMLARTIPVYWGSNRISDYFNSERLLDMQDLTNDNIDDVINKMIEIKKDDNKWLSIVNKPVFSGNDLSRTIDNISRDIKLAILPKPWQTINRVFVVSNIEFEQERYLRLCNLFDSLFKDYQLKDDYVTFMGKTYGHLLTDKDINDNIQKNIVQNVRSNPMKKAELSLCINYKEIINYIEKNYKEGTFIIFESDIYALDNITQINDFLSDLYTKREKWDLIHIGKLGENELFTYPFIPGITPYRGRVRNDNKMLQYISNNKVYIEDITNEQDKYRLIRKFHTRCCDSFIWNYSGISKMKKHLDKDKNFGAPWDYYLINKLENDMNFKHYWSLDTFFLQGSNNELCSSTLQNSNII